MVSTERNLGSAALMREEAFLRPLQRVKNQPLTVVLLP
jgi:hypothetical protein